VISPTPRSSATSNPSARGTSSSAPTTVRGKLAALAGRIAASPWGRPAAKIGLALLALVVLSAIGGSALAGAKAPVERGETGAFGPTGPPLLLDAGATAPPIVALAETVIEVPRSDASAESVTPPGSPGAHGKASPESPVTLNTATFEDLRRLPGVGPKKAEAILALRTKLGKFRRAEDLMRVKGIGRGTFKKLKPLVRVDEPAQAAVP
jgi:competence protein ComEA